MERIIEPDEWAIENVIRCGHCGSCHFDPNNRCPDCHAGLYWQCRVSENAIVFARKAIQDRSRRNFREALAEADAETLAWMTEEIGKIIVRSIS
jgi:uncharacterized OB-fold protein